MAGDSVLAFTTAQAAKCKRSLSRFVVRRQAWLFFPFTLFEGVRLHVDRVAAVITARNRSARGGSRLTEALTLMLHALDAVLSRCASPPRPDGRTATRRDDPRQPVTGITAGRARARHDFTESRGLRLGSLESKSGRRG